MGEGGQWLWFSWLSDCFWFQRSPARIQSSTKIILDIYCELYWKDENKEKEAGKAHLKKTFSWETVPSSGQSHKHFMLVNYNS